MLEYIEPKNEQEWLQMRVQDITSTEVAALFGISPYVTPFELWHQKRDKVVVTIEENERMKWGTALQDAIAKSIADDMGWIVCRMTEYGRNPHLRIGASFDFSIEGSEETGPTERKGLLEIKNVDGLVFRNDWIEKGEDNFEAPLHIEIQVQHQLMVSGREFAYLAALVGGNRLVLIKREPDPRVFTAINHKVTEFWRTIEQNIEPAPDFSVDAEFISKLYGFAEPGKTVNIADDEQVSMMAAEYKTLGDQAKIIEEQRDAIKAKLLMTIGDAEKALGNGFSITAGMVGPAHVEYDRAGYRGFRINWKKVK